MSVHIEAKKGEIAESILLPGDPLRAKWIAETFFENPYCYNRVRNMLGYTGMYKGKRISVQGTGMGIPSTLIYCHELINFYGVKNLIRVGSAGSYQENVKLRDIVVAMSASSTSNINKTGLLNSNYAPTADFDLFMKVVELAKNKNIPIKAGNILSSDDFYEADAEAYKKWAEMGVLCVEMETAGLYSIAAKYGAKALSVLTISDSLVTGESTSAKEREQTFHEMVKLALAAI